MNRPLHVCTHGCVISVNWMWADRWCPHYWNWNDSNYWCWRNHHFRIWCNPCDAFSIDHPMERREVGCIAPGGDMFETAVLTMFAAATLDNEVVASLLSIAHFQAGKESWLVYCLKHSQVWIATPGHLGWVVEMTPGAVWTGVGPSIGDFACATVGMTLTLVLCGLGFLVQILGLRWLAEEPPSAWFQIIGWQGVLIYGHVPFLDCHCKWHFQVSKHVCCIDRFLCDDGIEASWVGGDEYHLTEYIVNIDENQMAQPSDISCGIPREPMLESWRGNRIEQTLNVVDDTTWLPFFLVEHEHKSSVKVCYCGFQVIIGTLFASEEQVHRKLGGVGWCLTNHLLTKGCVGFFEEVLVPSRFHLGWKEREHW